MSHTNATNFRIRVINPYFYGNWQEVNDYNKAADEIIKTPEKYLLSNSALFEAEGGYGGLGLQLAVMALGVGSVFASSARMGMYWKSGSMKWMEWLCLGGTAVGAHAIGQYASVNAMGNPHAYYSHWMAYGFVKSANRWEGRHILSKPPLQY